MPLAKRMYQKTCIFDDLTRESTFFGQKLQLEFFIKPFPSFLVVIT